MDKRLSNPLFPQMRYLKKNTEESKNAWSGELTSLFSAMNGERKKRMSSDSVFTDAEISNYEDEYDRILLEGRSANKGTSGKYAKKEEKALLNRLKKYKENHLLFLHDFQVDFSNNMSLSTAYYYPHVLSKTA